MRVAILDGRNGIGQIAGRDSGRWFPGDPASGIDFFVHKRRSTIHVRFHTAQPDTVFVDRGGAALSVRSSRTVFGEQIQILSWRRHEHPTWPFRWPLAARNGTWPT